MSLWDKLFGRSYSSPVTDLDSHFSLKTTITFDDILLQPQYSEIKSRKEVDTRSLLGDDGYKRIPFKSPIISSNMDSVTETEMALRMSQLGGFGVLHRYQGVQSVIDSIHRLSEAGEYAVPSIGVKDGEFEKAMLYLAEGASAICVDVAHGNSKMSVDMVSRIHKERPYANIIAGNVATYDGFARLADAGACAIRVGVGQGSACATRVVTGHGVPSVTSILDCVKAKKKFKEVALIVDGGIRMPGDFAKAIALGGDFVMLGGLLAGTDETPGKVIDGKKVYRGMASKEARENFDAHTPKDYTAEGVSVMKPVKGPVVNVINALMGGLRSAMSYTGASTIKEYQEKARFMLISHSSFQESLPHALEGNKMDFF